MHIPGFEGLKAHLPDYSDSQVKLLVARLPIIAILSIVFGFILDNSMRWLMVWFPNSTFIHMEPWIPIFIPLVLIFGGSQIAQTGFRRKKLLLNRDPKFAYQHVAKYVFTGVPMVFGGLLYGFLPHGMIQLGEISTSPPINSLTGEWSSSLLYLLFGIIWDVILRQILGIVLLIIAVGTVFRSVKEFGMDTSSLVYVYYPAEARVIQNKIYSIVRHPQYMAVVLMSMVGLCLSASIYSVIHLGITLGSFAYHILRREEPELIERFGESYNVYRKSVPAILIRPRNWGKLIAFLLGK